MKEENRSEREKIEYLREKMRDSQTEIEKETDAEPEPEPEPEPEKGSEIETERDRELWFAVLLFPAEFTDYSPASAWVGSLLWELLLLLTLRLLLHLPQDPTTSDLRCRACCSEAYELGCKRAIYMEATYVQDERERATDILSEIKRTRDRGADEREREPQREKTETETGADRDRSRVKKEDRERGGVEQMHFDVSCVPRRTKPKE